MRERIIGIAIPGAAAIAGAAALALWLLGGPRTDFEVRLEQAAKPPGASVAGVVVDLRGTLVKLDGKPADAPGAWPGFRGPNRTGISPEQTKVQREWPQAGPPAVWSIGVGEGHAGAAVLAGRAYLHDYDHEEQADVIRCLSLADGKDIWRHSYKVPVKRNHGMSRAVPAVTEKYLVALGPKCHVSCLDPKTGQYKWSIDLVREFGTKVPAWYAGQCPLIDGDRAIIAPAGKDVLMIAVDCETGEIIWRTPNTREWKMTHVSVVPMEFNGRRMYVYCGKGGVAGVSAEDGVILWETTDWRISVATVPTPVLVGAGRIFLSGGYNAGSMMLQLEEENNTITAQTLFSLSPKVFGSDQQTPIFYDGYIYGVIPGGRLVCLDLEGRHVWASDSTNKFGIGPYTIADGIIFVMDDHGALTMVEATPKGYSRLASAKVLPGHDSWGPMAFAGGKLIVRDLTTMTCLDVGVH
ncbi:MAG: PQQ-like beta-propeller repeat protein [Planctomycetes bacterium]|nr:PQQ-like beta-propeller repeat protein [Planctomycetota bacterium]